MKPNLVELLAFILAPKPLDDRFGNSSDSIMQRAIKNRNDKIKLRCLVRRALERREEGCLTAISCSLTGPIAI